MTILCSYPSTTMETSTETVPQQISTSTATISHVPDTTIKPSKDDAAAILLNLLSQLN